MLWDGSSCQWCFGLERACQGISELHGSALVNTKTLQFAMCDMQEAISQKEGSMSHCCVIRAQTGTYRDRRDSKCA